MRSQFKRADSLDARERVHEAHVDEGVGVHSRRHGPPRVQIKVRRPQQLVGVDEVGRGRPQQSHHHAAGGGRGREMNERAVLPQAGVLGCLERTLTVPH